MPIINVFYHSHPDHFLRKKTGPTVHTFGTITGKQDQFLPSRTRLKARERIIQIVTTSVEPELCAAGFRKSGLDFYRRLGPVLQLVQVQLSASNFYDRGHFSVSIGLAFDQIFELEQKLVVDQPKAYQCHYHQRMDRFIPGVPERWEVDEQVEKPGMGHLLRAGCRLLVGRLNGIDSIEHFLALGWLQAGPELGLRAQIYYLLGDTPSAIRDLQDPFFRSRPHWDFDDWLAQRGLGGLRDAIGGVG
jgi:hypothetical protein